MSWLTLIFIAQLVSKKYIWKNLTVSQHFRPVAKMDLKPGKILVIIKWLRLFQFFFSERCLLSFFGRIMCKVINWCVLKPQNFFKYFSIVVLFNAGLRKQTWCKIFVHVIEWYFSAWVFSCKFTLNFKNTFFEERFWRATSKITYLQTNWTGPVMVICAS